MNKFIDGARRPFEWVEIYQPFCALNYGVAPCQAKLGTTGAEKCYRTRATCQDPNNFDGSAVNVLRFCHNEASPPDDYTFFPLLESVSIGAAKLNLGGGDSSASALGIRGVLTASFSDTPNTDFITDPYLDERSYDPLTRGSFWAKWRARNPYYMHRVIKYKTGFLDSAGKVDQTTLTTRTFFITSFNGVNNDGSVTITAKDILTLTANEKAKAPNPSTGRLLANIAFNAASATLTPAGIGNLEYPAAGKIRIDKEVISFTRVGDILTLTGRGQNSTQAVDHNAGDTVQLCLIFGAIVGESPHAIIYNLLTNYAAVDPSYIDWAQWQNEAALFLPRLYNAIITAPEGVAALISEICEQCYLTLFWDDRTELLKLKAVRPAEGELITPLSDYANFLEGSFNITDKADNLITQVWVYFAQKDPTKTLAEPANYGALEIIGDPGSEAPDRNGIKKIKTIYSRWIEGGNGGAAIELGEKLLERFSAIQREAVFSLDAKDSFIWLADFITVENRNITDYSGLPAPLNMQVTSVSETIQGSEYTYTALEYLSKVYTPSGEIVLPISVSENNVNLRSLFERYLALTPQSGDVVRFIIPPNVVIGATPAQFFNGLFYTNTNLDSFFYTTLERELTILHRRDFVEPRIYNPGDIYLDPDSGLPVLPMLSSAIENPSAVSLETGDWPTGVTLILEIEEGAAIYGHGGAASMSQMQKLINGVFYDGSVKPLRSGDGGAAIKASYPIRIINRGYIAGGGGGGASYQRGATFDYAKDDGRYIFASGMWSGGGGAGIFGGAISNECLYNLPGDYGGVAPHGFVEPESGASEGALFSGGGGSKWNWQNIGGAEGTYQQIGNGGNLGKDGYIAYNRDNLTGEVIDQVSPITAFGIEIGQEGEPGRAGYAVASGGALITWEVKGDIQGEIKP